MPRDNKKELIRRSTPMVSPRIIPMTQPTLFQSLKQGFGFGVGSTVARNMFELDTKQTVDVIHKQEPSEKKDRCWAEREVFETCLKNVINDDGCQAQQSLYTHCIQHPELSSYSSR